MTFKDLIDQVVRTSGEQGESAYRDDARRWLNFVRAEIADRAFWRTAVRVGITLTTDSRTAGEYGIGAAYDHILGNYLWDETNNCSIRHGSGQSIGSRDPDQSVTGPPTTWSDAGVTTAGERQISLWPRPTDVSTIRFNAYLKVTDISAAQESLDNDPFYGSVSAWGACFMAGMRYWMEVDDGEGTDEPISMAKYELLLKRRIARNGADPLSSIPAVNLKNRVASQYGRLDPAHFDNR